MKMKIADCSSRTEGSHANGDVWTSHENPCVSCECRNGVAQCSRLPCDCSSSSSPSSSSASASASASTSASASGRAASEQCCPQCRSSIRNRPSMQCRHQELNKTFYDSGQRWIYQCQSCECLVRPQHPSILQIFCKFFANFTQIYAIFGNSSSNLTEMTMNSFVLTP